MAHSTDAIEIAHVQGGDTQRLEPEHHREMYEVEPDGNAFLAVFNEMMMGGRKKPVGQQEHTTDHEWPYEFLCTITNGETSAQTTFQVDNALPYKEGSHGTILRTNEAVRLSADPSNANTFAVRRGVGTTAAQAIVAGDVILFDAHTVTEAWTRSSARTNGTESHVDYLSTVQHAWGITYHSEQTKYWSGSEKFRVERAAKREWEREQNRHLIMSQPFKDISTNPKKPLYLCGGLESYGERYNRIEVSECMTWKHWNRINQIAKKRGGARQLVWFTSLNIETEASLWAKNSGVYRQDGDNSFGFTAAAMKNTAGVGTRIVNDHIFDAHSELEHLMIGVNFDYVEPCEMGSVYLQKECQDRGSGVKINQMTRIIGLHVKLPVAAIFLVRGVKSFKN